MKRALDRSRIRRSLAGWLCLGLLSSWCWTALAQTPAGMPARAPSRTPGEKIAVDQVKGETERQARQTIEALFARLCPGRCELVSLDLVVEEPQPVGEVAPGFEATSAAGVYTTTVKRLSATVLLDAKLPRNFQANIPRMLQYRLQSLAPLVDVRPEVLDFPEPQLQPMPPLLPEVPRTPQQVQMPGASGALRPEPLPGETALGEQLEEATGSETLLEAVAPWIGPLVLILVLLIAALILLRRIAAVRDAKAGATGGAAAAAEAPASRTDLDALRAELTGSRAVRNRVLRQWLEDDASGVASLVRLYGADLLADLKTDPGLRNNLVVVGSEVARETQPLDDNEVEHVARSLRARLTAAQLVHDGDDLEHHWEFLEAISVANLRRVLGGFSTAERAYVVSRLPSGLRAAYLQGLDEEARRELFLGTGSDMLTKQEAIDLASRLRKASEALSHIRHEHEAQSELVLDMLRALPLEEQEKVLLDLREQRPEVAEVVLSRTLLDGACLHVPAELLGDAVHRTPVATLVAFLGSTRPKVRDHILASSPEGRRRVLASELGLGTPVNREERIAAREAVTEMLLKTLLREGQDPLQLNTRALDHAPGIHAVSGDEAIA